MIVSVVEPALKCVPSSLIDLYGTILQENPQNATFASIPLTGMKRWSRWQTGVRGIMPNAGHQVCYRNS